MLTILFLTIFILGPITVAHIFLHLFLKFWRRYPLGLYILCVAVWAIFFKIAGYFAARPFTLFSPPFWLKIFCAAISLAALALVVWSVFTLKPRRFFLLAVLRPKKVEQKHIAAGPYNFFPHPAYAAYVITAFAAFLATGEMALLWFWLAMFGLMFVVIFLEKHELLSRLKNLNYAKL